MTMIEVLKILEASLSEEIRLEGELLEAGTEKRDALVTLLLLTSFETYSELREAGLTDRQVAAYLKDAAARELVAPAG